MTKTEAAARRRRVVDLVNAISNLERDDLHHVLTKAIMPDLTSSQFRQNISLGVRSLEGGFLICGSVTFLGGKDGKNYEVRSSMLESNSFGHG
jgi:hypothetical protein